MSERRTPQVGEVWTSKRTGDVTIVAVGPEHVGYDPDNGYYSCLPLGDFLRHFAPPAEPWPDLPPVRWGFQARSDGFEFTTHTEAVARRAVTESPGERRLIRWTPEVVE